MRVRIKSFDVEMELKNKGVELEIRDNNDDFKGDLIVTKTKLIWCKGRTARENGSELKIEAFIRMMEDQA